MFEIMTVHSYNNCSQTQINPSIDKLALICSLYFILTNVDYKNKPANGIKNFAVSFATG